MHISALVVPVALAVTLTGCGSIGAIGINSGKQSSSDIATPVAVSPVQSQSLPPPPGTTQSSGPIVGAAPPGGAYGTGTDMASVNPQQAPASSGSLGRTDLLGGWTIASGGESCQLFMTLTSWTGGYRASTRGCAAEPLKSISAWNLSGNQVVLAGSGGSPVATLQSAGGNRFNGQTGQGSAVSFYR